MLLPNRVLKMGPDLSFRPVELPLPRTTPSMLVLDNRLYFLRMLSPLDWRWGGAGADMVRVETVSGSILGVTGVLG